MWSNISNSSTLNFDISNNWMFGVITFRLSSIGIFQISCSKFLPNFPRLKSTSVQFLIPYHREAQGTKSLVKKKKKERKKGEGEQMAGFPANRRLVLSIHFPILSLESLLKIVHWHHWTWARTQLKRSHDKRRIRSKCRIAVHYPDRMVFAWPATIVKILNIFWKIGASFSRESPALNAVLLYAKGADYAWPMI